MSKITAHDDLPSADEMAAAEGSVDEVTGEDRAAVRKQLDDVREFVGTLSMSQIKSGDWFVSLLRESLTQYSQQVTAEWLRDKYPHLPPDAVADARIRLAARYASIEGGLSAAAYTGAVAATISTGGGASPLTAPAAATSFVLDLVYTSRLQLRLAHDIAMLYNVPINLQDSEDLWKLVRIALVIKSSEVGRGAAVKGVPMVLRPLIKKVYGGATLKAAKSLPIVGKYLLQRNLIKFSIPGVTVPLSTAINFWTTRSAGEYAKTCFRNEARIEELVERAMQRTPHHAELLWLIWLVAQANGKVTEEEKSLLAAATDAVAARNSEAAVLGELRSTVEIDESDVLARVAALPGDLMPLYEVAVATAEINGKTERAERKLLDRIGVACRVDVAESAVEGGSRSLASRGRMGKARVIGLLKRDQ